MSFIIIRGVISLLYYNRLPGFPATKIIRQNRILWLSSISPPFPKHMILVTLPMDFLQILQHKKDLSELFGNEFQIRYDLV